jgi:drug/metabolite transporter (DMT)-like permease
MSMPINLTMSAREWVLLLLLSVLWGGSFFFVGVASHALPPLTIVACRVAVAAAVLWIVIAVRGEPVPKRPEVYLAFCGMGFLNNAVPFFLYAWAQSHIGSSVAAILNATTPLFTVLVAHRFTSDEPLTANRLAGVALGFAGVAVMIGGEALLDFGVNVTAKAACLAAAACYAFAGVYGRRFRRLCVTPLATAAGQVAASSAMLVPLALFADAPWTLPKLDASVIAAVLALGVFATAFAYLIYFRLLATAGATNLLLVTLLIPVTATTLGVLVLDEHFTAVHAAGLTLIALGLLVLDGRLISLPRRRERLGLKR